MSRPATPPIISRAEILRVFARIGVLSFGGPAAQIALMHKELVEDRPWLSEPQFLRALSFCMLLPGPEAMQLASYAGWRLAGVWGGLMAGLLFVMPGAVVVLALASAYAAYGDLPWVSALFLGIKAAVIVIVLQALIKVAQRALAGGLSYALAAAAFLGIFAFQVPFPLIVAAAAVIGALAMAGSVPDEAEVPPVSLGATAATVMLWGALWLVPLAGLWAVAPDGLLTQVGLFFAKLAVVTFGGAYAVLAYMVQEVVVDYGWLTPDQMMDALGLAETTPGPLILVTEFVGFLAGAQAGGWGLGLAAALVTLWVTFVPCFLWIFAGAPYIDWLATRPRLTGALRAITAAVVGVILNLSVWFAVHVLFADLTPVRLGPAEILVPVAGSLDPVALALTGVAAALLWGLKWDLLRIIPGMALAGLALTWAVQGI